MTDMEPEVSEVLQEEVTDAGIVPVRIEGALRTQTLPRKAATSKSHPLTASGSVIRVLGANPRRASAVLVSSDGDFYVAFNVASKEDVSTMAKWPKGVPLTVTADTDVFVRDAGMAMLLSVITENWAAGDGEF